MLGRVILINWILETTFFGFQRVSLISFCFGTKTASGLSLKNDIEKEKLFGKAGLLCSWIAHSPMFSRLLLMREDGRESIEVN